MTTRRRALYIAVAAGSLIVDLGACGGSGPTSASAAPTPSAECVADPAFSEDFAFERSPGGVPEVDATWLHNRGCNVRIVDVREADELAGPLGAIPTAENVPLDSLMGRAAAWHPDEPIVLVCRSGRRTVRGVRMLEDLGFTRVASLAGGMMIWRERSRTDASYAVTRWERAEAGPTQLSPHRASSGPLDRDTVLELLSNDGQIRWVKAAALLLQGTQSCVDGRAPRPVIGTPGGDAGELLLALAALERVRGEELPRERVGAILDAYISSFGRFYIHTDAHALSALSEHLVTADGSLSGGAEALVRRPPRHLEGELLDALTDPRHVGCGHLKLVLTHPEEYGVRAELTRTLLREVFVRLWRGDAIDFVVLEGDHHEGAVVNVVLGHEVHAFSRIPTVNPRDDASALFVNHPEVSAWLREQKASFFFEIDPWLHEDESRRTEFLSALSELGRVQLESTLRYLAAEILVYEAHVSTDHIRLAPSPSTRARSQP